MVNNNSTTRFSDRVENYSKYRPSYPIAAIDWICQQYSPSPDSIIADIGSGTGIFSGLLLERGLQVVAVEPNENMRAMSNEILGDYSLYRSVPGTAENTTLDAQSVDIVVAAQAFHWFDIPKTKTELRRVLKPDGIAVFVWNRRDDTSDFQQEYENLLRQLPDYNAVKHTKLSDAEDIVGFFSGSKDQVSFPNSQKFDLKGFKGRVFSSSYTPGPNDKGFKHLDQQLESLFNRYCVDNEVVFEYKTAIFSGSLL